MFRRRAATLMIAAAIMVTTSLASSADELVTCPERIETTDAKLAKPAQIVGFVPVIGGSTSQAWLQDVALFGRIGGKLTPMPGVVKGQRRIEWRPDGQTDIWVSCVYEAGITLHRSVGQPNLCTAAFLRSTDQGGTSWGMDRAGFKCERVGSQ